MPVTSDIVRTWRAPRVVMRDLLAQGRREDRAIAYLMTACILILIAQLPRLRREAFLRDTMPTVMTQEQLETFADGWSAFDQNLAYAVLAWIMIWPLFLYMLAGVTHALAKLVGGQGDGYGARLALFWSMLASVPFLLLHGLTAGLIGPGLQTDLVGAVWVATFGYIWFQTLREAEKKR